MKKNLSDMESRTRRYNRHPAGVMKRNRIKSVIIKEFKFPRTCKKDEFSDEGSSFIQYKREDDDHNYECQAESTL